MLKYGLALSVLGFSTFAIQPSQAARIVPPDAGSIVLVQDCGPECREHRRVEQERAEAEHRRWEAEHHKRWEDEHHGS